MKYEKRIRLKDGRDAVIRHASVSDAKAVMEIYELTHRQTDFLSSYPGEAGLTLEKECRFLEERERSLRDVHLCAVVDGKIVGTAGMEAISRLEKMRHRANFGIGIDRAYWGLGIGSALTEACIECAEKAGYLQIELEVVAKNRTAVALYEKLGFREYGRNPLGFRPRSGELQELILMRMEL